MPHLQTPVPYELSVLSELRRYLPRLPILPPAHHHSSHRPGILTDRSTDLENQCIIWQARPWVDSPCRLNPRNPQAKQIPPCHHLTDHHPPLQTLRIRSLLHPPRPRSLRQPLQLQKMLRLRQLRSLASRNSEVDLPDPILPIPECLGHPTNGIGKSSESEN